MIDEPAGIRTLINRYLPIASFLSVVGFYEVKSPLKEYSQVFFRRRRTKKLSEADCAIHYTTGPNFGYKV
jgi:hypothetical protein